MISRKDFLILVIAFYTTRLNSADILYSSEDIVSCKITPQEFLEKMILEIRLFFS